jgi:hypothetical protein
VHSSPAPDAPFPGALPQVRGHRGELDTLPPGSTLARNGTLPLDATPVQTRGQGWAVTLPCRAEEVQVRKVVVVYEEVVLRRDLRQAHVDVEARAKREELRVEENYAEGRAASNRLIRARGE